jgi:2-oxoglutarate/2-oxoacid ferredoxin oxidoreductase subunit alpha
MEPSDTGGAPRGVSIALAGSGGSGVMTAGNLLLSAAARAGRYGLMVRTSGPQIRGGEAAALIRLADRQVESLDDAFDVLLALDWHNMHRFVDEIPMRAGGLLIGEQSEGEPPAAFVQAGARSVALPLRKMAKAIPGGWPNMIALGLAGALAGIPEAALQAAVRDAAASGEAAGPRLAAVGVGYAAAADISPPLAPPPRAAAAKRWLLSGNEAAGYGAIRAGVRFVAAYPITPATELLEWMAPALAKVGGTLLQAEDELASINMIVGASYGGVPSLTATAGPGLSLMAEGIGLAVAAEIPIVVVDVMRGGPSTGIPAKSEQADLSFAVSGLHGDAPRLVLAPTSVGDCLATTRWAVELAETLQAPAIVLSDQFLGQTRAILERPADDAQPPVRRLAADPHAPGYARYALTDSGVSPMAIPGTPGTAYTADGLEHNERGIPSSQAHDHRAQLDKRARKLADHRYDARWADVEGDAALAVLTFGSSSGPVREALGRAAAEGLKARMIAIRLLAPLQPEQLAQALAGVRRLLVVEQNHGAQLYRYLRAWIDLPADTRSYHRPGPLPLRPGELLRHILEWGRS